MSLSHTKKQINQRNAFPNQFTSPPSVFSLVPKCTRAYASVYIPGTSLLHLCAAPPPFIAIFHREPWHCGVGRLLYLWLRYATASVGVREEREWRTHAEITKSSWFSCLSVHLRLFSEVVLTLILLVLERRERRMKVKQTHVLPAVPHTHTHGEACKCFCSLFLLIK